MKGYVKADITEEEIQLMRAKIDKALAFVNKWNSGEYDLKRTVRSFIFFTKDVVETDYDRADKDAESSYCSITHLDYHFTWVDMDLCIDAYSKILSLSKIGDVYLDNKLAAYLKEIKKEIKNERN